MKRLISFLMTLGILVAVAPQGASAATSRFRYSYYTNTLSVGSGKTWKSPIIHSAPDWDLEVNASPVSQCCAVNNMSVTLLGSTDVGKTWKTYISNVHTVDRSISVPYGIYQMAIKNTGGSLGTLFVGISHKAFAPYYSPVHIPANKATSSGLVKTDGGLEINFQNDLPSGCTASAQIIQTLDGKKFTKFGSPVQLSSSKPTYSTPYVLGYYETGAQYRISVTPTCAASWFVLFGYRPFAS